MALGSGNALPRMGWELFKSWPAPSTNFCGSDQLRWIAKAICSAVFSPRGKAGSVDPKLIFITSARAKESFDPISPTDRPDSRDSRGPFGLYALSYMLDEGLGGQRPLCWTKASARLSRKNGYCFACRNAHRFAQLERAVEQPVLRHLCIFTYFVIKEFNEGKANFADAGSRIWS